MDSAVQTINNLTIGFTSQKGKQISILKNISTTIKKGETVGIVGESGSGKCTLALAMMGYVQHGLYTISGECLFHSNNLLEMKNKDLENIRGRKIAMIPQNAGQSLTPNLKIGYQIDEALKLHTDLKKEERDKKISELLNKVRLPSPEIMAQRYPHELSGGMKQRAVIALALSCDPKVIIADEPTTALDVVIQDQILNEIKKVQDLLGLSLIYISHDIAVIAEMTDKIAVMYAGSIVEIGPTKDVFKTPKHSYTRALLDSTPSIRGEKKKLRSLDGEPPSLINEITGCSFSPRCPTPTEKCKNQSVEMNLIKVGENHFADECCSGCV